MSARFRTSTVRATAIAILAALAVIAGPVLAKEGAVAKLDTPVRRDAEPGSIIKIGWSILMAADGQMRPIFGSPTFVRLVSPDGKATTEAFGHETAFESGHYIASIVVPAGGIGNLIVGMRGEACTAGGGCQRADHVFPLNDDALVSGVPKPAPRASAITDTTTSGAADPAATSQPAPVGVTSGGGGLALLAAVGAAFALAGGRAAVLVMRRRRIPVDAASR